MRCLSVKIFVLSTKIAVLKSITFEHLDSSQGLLHQLLSRVGCAKEGRFPNKEVIGLARHYIKTFIEGIVKSTRSGFEPKFIDKALNRFRMPIHKANHEVRVLHYVNCFFE